MFVKRNYETIESYRKFDVTSMSLTLKDVLKHSLQIYITPPISADEFHHLPKTCKLLVTPATIFHPNMFFFYPPNPHGCWIFHLDFVKAPLITKEEGKLWPHNETALQMRDKV